MSRKSKVAVALTAEERARLERFSLDEGISMSSALRRWVRSLPLLSSHGEGDRPTAKETDR